MTDPLLITKIKLPVLRHTLVSRQAIIHQLSKGVQEGNLLTLISAPAGYGKTTIVRMWVKELNQPVAWISLEKSDNSLKQFLVYVLTALQAAVDNLGKVALELVESNQEIKIQNVLGLLINDLYTLKKPIILVLDDYHVIENKEIDQAIELILNQSLTNLHLVITSREDPNLPLARLRVRNQLSEIRAAVWVIL